MVAEKAHRVFDFINAPYDTTTPAHVNDRARERFELAVALPRRGPSFVNVGTGDVGGSSLQPLRR
jgi:hypothetical protein